MLWGHISSRPLFWPCKAAFLATKNCSIGRWRNPHFSSNRFVGVRESTWRSVCAASGRGFPTCPVGTTAFVLKCTHPHPKLSSYPWLKWMDGQVGCEPLTEIKCIEHYPVVQRYQREGKLLLCIFLASCKGWVLCMPCEAPPSPSSHWWVTSAKPQVNDPFPGNRALNVQEKQTARLSKEGITKSVLG